MFSSTLLLLLFVTSVTSEKQLFEKKLGEDLYARLLWFDQKEERCYDTLQTVMECVFKNDYRLHFIPNMEEVREKWLSNLLSSPEKLEKLTALINRKLPATIEKELKTFKESDAYTFALEADVLVKLKKVVAESVRSDVSRMEERFEEIRETTLQFVGNQRALFVQELSELIHREQDRTTVSPPPSGAILTSTSPTKHPSATSTPYRDFTTASWHIPDYWIVTEDAPTYDRGFSPMIMY